MLRAPAPEPGLPRQVQSKFVPGRGVLVPDDPVAAVAGMDHDVRPVAGSSRLPIELRPRREALARGDLSSPSASRSRSSRTGWSTGSPRLAREHVAASEPLVRCPGLPRRLRRQAVAAAQAGDPCDASRRAAAPAGAPAHGTAQPDRGEGGRRRIAVVALLVKAAELHVPPTSMSSTPPSTDSVRRARGPPASLRTLRGPRYSVQLGMMTGAVGCVIRRAGRGGRYPADQHADGKGEYALPSTFNL